MTKMAENHKKLPVLEGWLEKKSAAMGKRWQTRWVIVRKSYLLWSDVQRDIKSPRDVRERMKFNNSVSLMSIKDVQAVTEGKSQRKFKILAEANGGKRKKKEYLWKCSSQKDRDDWVVGLKSHIKQIKSVLSYLDDSPSANKE